MFLFPVWAGIKQEIESFSSNQTSCCLCQYFTDLWWGRLPKIRKSKIQKVEKLKNEIYKPKKFKNKNQTIKKFENLKIKKSKYQKIKKIEKEKKKKMKKKYKKEKNEK